MPQLDKNDLDTLDADLGEFHKVKQVFVTEKAHTLKYGLNNISKLHAIQHYSHIICAMGTPDGFTTKTPEWLHKDYIKVSYHASNGIVPEPQMLTHLRHQEAWRILQARYKREGVVEWREQCGWPEEEPIDKGIIKDWVGEDLVDEDWEDEEDGLTNVSNNALEKYDEAKSVEGEVNTSVRDNRVGDAKEWEVFQFDLVTQIAKHPVHVTTAWNHTPLFLSTVIAFIQDLNTNLAFHLNKDTKFGIWTKFSIHHEQLPFAPLAGHRIDLVCASPARHTLGGHITCLAIFDTVLMETYPNMVGLLHEQFHCFLHVWMAEIPISWLQRLSTCPCSGHISAPSFLPQGLSRASGICWVVWAIQSKHQCPNLDNGTQWWRLRPYKAIYSYTNRSKGPIDQASGWVYALRAEKLMDEAE
jgi:hypothetical protein